MAVPTELLKMPLVNGVPIKHGMRSAQVQSSDQRDIGDEKNYRKVY